MRGVKEEGSEAGEQSDEEGGCGLRCADSAERYREGYENALPPAKHPSRDQNG